MATYTSNYGWAKPSGSDNVDINVLNDNLDDQDSTIHDAFLNMAPPFSESSTYAVDDIVLYGTGLYKCHTAVVTPGSWTGSTNWQVHKLSEGGSGGGGSSLTAGDYIEIDENNKINVKMEKGDITEYEYRFTGAYSPTNQLTIEKYRNGILVSTESYRNDASYTPIAIDGLFEIWYTAGSPRYYWHYKLLEDSREHSAGYEDSWYYTDTTTRTETFDVEDDSLTLVRKGDLEEAVNGLTQIMGNVKMTKLWENPDPTQPIAPNTEFTINTAGYDFVLFESCYSTGYLQYKNSYIVRHGSTVTLTQSNSNGTSLAVRNFNYVDDTKYMSAAAYIAGQENTTFAIPVAAYGIKLT